MFAVFTGKIKSISYARYTMFKLGKCNADSLPPNFDSLHQHILRANFESYIRKHAAIPILAAPSLVGYVWKLEDNQLQIVWGTQEPAPESILEGVILYNEEQLKEVKHWNNNNCESLNNILKLSTNWKVLKLPDLIEKIYSIIKLQYAMRRALHGHGNYQVIPQLRSFVLSNTAWSQKNEDEKDIFKNSSLSTVQNEKVVTSTDGALHIPKTPSNC